MAVERAPSQPAMPGSPRGRAAATIRRVKTVAPLCQLHPVDAEAARPGPQAREAPVSEALPGTQKSTRYSLAKTHLHYQKDTIRQYRKSERGWHCLEAVCGRGCSRRSPTGFWIDSHQANFIAYMGIFLNTLFFSFQAYLADHLHMGKQRRINDTVYCAVELGFILLFCVELLLRLRATHSPGTGKWNQYDGAFLIMCFVDCCILVFTSDAADAHRVVVHLLPTLQVFRLGRFVQELRLLIQGIFSAMRAVLWAACLLALVIYFFGVLSNNYIGQAQRFQGDETAERLFGSLSGAMLTLFAFATLEDFPDAVRHFMKAGEVGEAIIAVAIIAFILFTNLALLNLVTAVMVDSIIDILPKKHTEALARERAEMVHRLEAIFLKMDGDGDRKLTLEEFTSGVENHVEVQNELSLLQIAALDVRELFKLLDFNDTGAVSVDEFIDGLLRMVPTPASKKELLGMEYDMHKMWNMLASGQEQIMAHLEQGLQEQLLVGMDRLLQERVERCLKESRAQEEQQFKELLDALASQLLSSQHELLTGQRELLKAVAASSSAEALAKVHRSLEDLPAALAEDQRRALDSQAKGLLEALEASSSASTTASATDLSRLGRLVEELKEGQQQLLAASEHSRSSGGGAESAMRCSAEPEPSCQQRSRPPPLASACLTSGTPAAASATAPDAGPEPEPFSVPATPAMRGCPGVPGGTGPSSMRAGPPPCLAPMPEVRPLLACQSLPEAALEAERARRSAPLPPVSLMQLQPPPQFQYSAGACASRALSAAAAEAAERATGGVHAGSLCGGLLPPAPATAQELQALLQAALAAQTLPAAALSAGCVPQGTGQGRVGLVQQWVHRQGWAGVPFDKLVLHLDRLGVELSEGEQDALRWCLRHPCGGVPM